MTTNKAPQRAAVLRRQPALAVMLLLSALGCERAAQEGNAEPAPATKVMAYYFHQSIRCKTCLSIESQAKSAVEVAFADELASGTVAWSVIDYETPDNRHFEQDFDLDGSSLVIAGMKGGETTRWTCLEKTWDLVDDPAAFQEYVWAELGSYLEP